MVFVSIGVLVFNTTALQHKLFLQDTRSHPFLQSKDRSPPELITVDGLLAGQRMRLQRRDVVRSAGMVAV
jgi:hypothetical protein